MTPSPENVACNMYDRDVYMQKRCMHIYYYFFHCTICTNSAKCNLLITFTESMQWICTKEYGICWGMELGTMAEGVGALGR